VGTCQPKDTCQPKNCVNCLYKADRSFINRTSQTSNLVRPDFSDVQFGETRGGGLGSRPKKMYGERLGDGVEYHLMKPTPRR